MELLAPDYGGTEARGGTGAAIRRRIARERAAGATWHKVGGGG